MRTINLVITSLLVLTVACNSTNSTNPVTSLMPGQGDAFLANQRQQQQQLLAQQKQQAANAFTQDEANYVAVNDEANNKAADAMANQEVLAAQAESLKQQLLADHGESAISKKARLLEQQNARLSAQAKALQDEADMNAHVGNDVVPRNTYEEAKQINRELQRQLNEKSKEEDKQNENGGDENGDGTDGSGTDTEATLTLGNITEAHSTDDQNIVTYSFTSNSDVALDLNKIEWYAFGNKYSASDLKAVSEDGTVKAQFKMDANNPYTVKVTFLQVAAPVNTMEIIIPKIEASKGDKEIENEEPANESFDLNNVSLNTELKDEKYRLQDGTDKNLKEYMTIHWFKVDGKHEAEWTEKLNDLEFTKTPGVPLVVRVKIFDKLDKNEKNPKIFQIEENGEVREGLKNDLKKGKPVKQEKVKKEGGEEQSEEGDEEAVLLASELASTQKENAKSLVYTVESNNEKVKLTADQIEIFKVTDFNVERDVSDSENPVGASLLSSDLDYKIKVDNKGKATITFTRGEKIDVYLVKFLQAGEDEVITREVSVPKK